MSIRSICAAAVVVIGVGEAEAATVENYDLYLRYEGTEFLDYVLYDGRDRDNAYVGERYPAEDPLNLNIPHEMFPTLARGDIVRFIATIVFPEDPMEILEQWDNGGRAPICSIGATSCTNTQSAYQRGAFDAFEITFSDSIAIAGSTLVGSQFRYSMFDSSAGEFGKDEWMYRAMFANAMFTVVQVVDTPAPIPLPATGALLPLGIGALAVMRRRRRS